MNSQRLTAFQKVAIAALISLIVLIFVGATVRVTGSGMGCPDWPTCWNCLIPPTSVEQVDFESLDIEKFQRKAARHGRDPSEITVEALRAEFNPVHVWTEFINRLFSLPVGFTSLALFIMASRRKSAAPLIFWCSFAALFLVLLNAWMGARIVYSGLKPGTITTHMILAIILQAVLIFTAWRGGEHLWRIHTSSGAYKLLKFTGILLLGITILEIVTGSQVREMTDTLAKEYAGEERNNWVENLEKTKLYLFHRSFSWAILLVTLVMHFLIKQKEQRSMNWVEISFTGIVLVQMFLGVIMSQFAIYRWVQVLHVGLATVMVSLLIFWNLALNRQDS